MTVATAAPGQIVELLERRFGETVASGRIYKIGDTSPTTGRVRAWGRFRSGPIELHPSIECRDVSDDIDAPTWKF